MIIPFAALSPTRTYDACIVGSGPAGMSTAMALAAGGKSVLLLEGGLAEFTAESQEQYQGEVVGDPYFDLQAARLRFLGGSSNHWAGWCRPLDAFDFAPKPFAPLAHWPIGKADLDPFQRRTDRILNLPPTEPDRPRGHGVQQIAIHFDEATVRFGQTYRKALEQSRLVELCMGANLTAVTLGGGGLQSLRVTDYAGQQRQVRAKHYVLACGGIENSRLLLHLNRETNGALVKEARTLGRYWMEHPVFTLGEMVMREFPDRRSFYSLDGPTKMRLGILNAGLRVQNVPRSRWRETADRLACVAPALGAGIYDAMRRDLVCGAYLRACWEQEPRAANRVELSPTAKDRFGIPHSILHWTKSEKDLTTIRESALQFGRYLAATDQGRLKLVDWVLGKADYPTDDELAGYHHMGGTRMSRTPAEGIVDRDCKVWGQDNLFVAGSSVFPSAGHANPTYTIVQLGLRLGEHLAARA
jgi:choline dehydrogenase-like flavoprotein